MAAVIEQPTESAAAALLAGLIASARAGQLTLPEVMERAGQLQQAGQAEAAVLLYETWIHHSQAPMRHVACFNWGTMLGALGRHDAAEAAYRQALVLQPGFPPARLNLGHLLERRGEQEAALAEWQGVIDSTDAVTPAVLDLRLHALNNSARLLESAKRYPESEAFMRRSLELKPRQFDVIQHYVHIRQKQCAWPWFEPVGEVTPHELLIGTSPLAMMSVTDDPAVQLLAAMRFVHERVPKPPAAPMFASMPPPYTKGRAASASATCRATCTTTRWAC